MVEPLPAATAEATANAMRPRRGWPLHTRILLGIVLGAVLGLTASTWNGSFSDETRPDLNGNRLHDQLDPLVGFAAQLGKVFLRLMSMVVVPLVFSALVLAVVELGDLKRLGRLGLRTLLLTLFFSATSVLLGIGLVNWLQPGLSLNAAERATLRAQYGVETSSGDAQKSIDQAKRAKTLGNTLLDIIPENPLQEMVGALDGSSKGNGMLAVMFFSLIFGAALAAERANAAYLIGALQSLQAVCMRVIDWAMQLAPLGAGCLVFAVTAALGMKFLLTLFWFVCTVVLGLLLQYFVTYSLALHWLSRFKPWEFWRLTSAASLTAFGTSSSNATLPTAIRTADEELKLPPEVSRFVLTVGATGNQNGTALYEGVVVLFLAQLLLEQPLDFTQQLRVVLMSVLAGVGTAGVPGGSLPLIVVVLQSLGIPAGGIGVILGVDRLLDMCRTTLNVSGDLVVAACAERAVTGENSTSAPQRHSLSQGSSAGS